MTTEEERELAEMTEELKKGYLPKIETAVSMAHVVLRLADMVKGKFPIAELVKTADELFDELKPLGDLIWEGQKTFALRRAQLVDDIASRYSHIDGDTAWKIVEASNPIKSLVQLAETQQKKKS